VRTALFFHTRGAGHTVLQITSPNMGDGKSTLSANLAISIAQSGRKVVLVDADFRRPRLHRLFRVKAVAGLATVIAGGAEPFACVQESGIGGLAVLPAGPRPLNPAELLTSPRLEEVLEQLRERYDYVVVDTPPLLAVTDPCVIAPRVDGVLLNLRIGKNSRPAAERAREMLAALGAKVLGVVVNGVGKEAGAAGFGYSRYAYEEPRGYKPEDGEGEAA
jgi:capsular exopolysaccharide synthesis family protein